MRDIDVRTAVRRKLAARYSGDPTTRIVEEMGIWSGSVRIDIAVIHGELYGVELKSDRDTLERLPFQADLYSRVFDKIELVVGSRHSDRGAEIVPKWWKITIATMKDGEVHLRPMAGFPGRKNPCPDPYLVAQLLWKEEGIAILDKHGRARGFRSRPIKAIHKRLATELKFELLSKEVRESLKERPSQWLGQQVADQLDVTIDAELNPMLKPLWTGTACYNRVNGFVSPTMQSPTIGMLGDSVGMSDELGPHFDSAEPGGSNATADEKMVGQSVAHIDRKSPRYP